MCTLDLGPHVCSTFVDDVVVMLCPSVSPYRLAVPVTLWLRGEDKCLVTHGCCDQGSLRETGRTEAVIIIS